MSICFLHSHGGNGSGDLNFSIIGGEMQPSNPTENTIWIKTATPITSWMFSTEEPTELIEGVVWITTGVTSIVSFNALKKNKIQVYPTEVKQYVDNKWIRKEAFSYISKSWIQFSNLALPYFYDNGSKNVTLQGYYSESGGILTVQSTAADTHRTAECYFTIPNIEYYSSIAWNFSSVTGPGTNLYIRNANTGENVINKALTGGASSVDVSSLSGSGYYLVIRVQSSWNGSNFDLSTVKVNKIWGVAK